MPFRRKNRVLQERQVISFDHGAISADDNQKLWKVPDDFQIDRVLYVNPTGVAADPTNFVAVELRKGALTAASLPATSDTAIAADTFVEMTLDTDNTVLSAGDEISLNVDVTGTGSLPVGRVIIEGSYI